MAANDGVKAAGMCLKILDHIAFLPEPAGVTQIAEAAGIAKSAAFKHLHTLIEHGFVAQDPLTARYRLGPRAWLIGQQAQNLKDITAIALPHMQAARNDVGLAVVLSTPMPTSALVVLTCSSVHPIEIGVRVGSHLALHASAQGKVFLAHDAARLPGSGPLPAITPHTVTRRDRLAAEYDLIRQRGYADAPQQSLLGINAIAAPVFDYGRTLVGSVGFVGSVQYLPDTPHAGHVARLLELTRHISTALGAGPEPA